MATGKAFDGKPYAGNPHVRFDEGEVAPAATPRRGSLLYVKRHRGTTAARPCVLVLRIAVDESSVRLVKGIRRYADAAG